MSLSLSTRPCAVVLAGAVLSCCCSCSERRRLDSPAPPAATPSGSTATDLPAALPSPPSPPAASPVERPAPSDPSLLPQTRDVPSAAGAQFEARARGLWDAIIEDDPSRAMAFFFPVAAYAQVKDVPNPTADWKHRLVAAYERDIHVLHGRLGSSAHAAQFVALEVPDNRGRWVNPGEEYNKLGYYRVFGSKLRFAEGSTARTFDVKSLISWRGEWYVVHLSAIK
jgi:hypothetical protein